MHWSKALFRTATVLAVSTLVAMSVSAQAQNYKVIYAFHGSFNNDGEAPLSTVTPDAKGNLWGTTSFGPNYDACTANYETTCGTFYELDKTGKEIAMYATTGAPNAALTRDTTGNFYSTTPAGGADGAVCDSGCGTVFMLTPEGNGRALYEFNAANGSTDGNGPLGGVVPGPGDSLYGTTYFGGNAYYHCGTVYKVDKGGNETVLYSFTCGSDGGGPEAGLVIDTSGNLYGTTSGGGAYNHGTVFMLDKTGKETVLHSFTGGADGAYPYGALTRDAAGNLYGTTNTGGDLSCSPYGCGLVFKIDASGVETVLHNFSGGADGEFPVAGLVRDADGNLYGTTEYGGTGSCGTSGCGTVFKIDAAGNETVLWSFMGGAGGQYPLAGLYRSRSGILYGTTYIGGDLSCDEGAGNGCGTVFELKP